MFCNGQPNRYCPDVSGATNGCHRNIGSAKGDEFVCFPMGILGGGVTLAAQRPVRVQVFNPLTGVVVSNVTLTTGLRFVLPQGPGAFILRGRFLEAEPSPGTNPQRPPGAPAEAGRDGPGVEASDSAGLR